ncbi:FAD-dependent monooxygenase [Streptomyces sp. LP05-1]|uniref:FAD-dependent monooxygenase n=1 Tax=Streptomyces pyxinae TaxID=2970734 RepID=A0ABT2CH90_9ACTN|nr:FAD-dependent monooxygenase [Streptomyces sp. LP05-1]MCS0636787.1 FAD-dependent monooxygenase [Streptomyces sp. LP05-1]
MKIVCVGGGPAALHFAALMRLQDPSHEIIVYERDPAGSTYGWGVTYWGGLLDRLRHRDPVTAAAVRAHSVSRRDGIAHIGDRTARHRGDENFAIGRHRLLAVLAGRAASLGVRLEYERELTDPDGADLAGADLVVAADGAGSALRTRYAAHFGTRLTPGRNSYAWLGTTRVLDAFTFAFVPTPHGWIWCYGYGYGEGHSTFLVECAPATWTGLGLDGTHRAGGPGDSGGPHGSGGPGSAHGPGATDGSGNTAGPAALATLEHLFAGVLDGHPLLTGAHPAGGAPRGPGAAGASGGQRGPGPAGGPRRLTFRTLTNRTWYRDNLVLIGDAAHTTHYSVGAGTTLALDDAAALAGALGRYRELPAALAHYDRERRAALVPAQSAARHSAQWYENLPRYIGLPPDRMFALLGQRHSPLLPYVPPRLYCGLDRAVDRLGVLRGLKRRIGPRLARALHPRP